MVSIESIEKQLKKINFNIHGWGRTEARELQHVLLEDEEIHEAVNGIYEGGFALMLATDIRVLLIDKKPLNYLSIEDMRYELISEIDYSHRLIGAYISLSSGSKNLKFSSLNQPRLRKLIGHVQNCMAQSKKQQATHPHLEQINQQLQAYLLAQYQQQQSLHDQLQTAWQTQKPLPAESVKQTEPVRPSHQLADYLFAQSLLEQHHARTGEPIEPPPEVEDSRAGNAGTLAAANPSTLPLDQIAELYSEGRKEIFAGSKRQAVPPPATHLKQLSTQALTGVLTSVQGHNFAEINPLHIAFSSKLPMMLRNRKFGRPLFHAHSQEAVSLPAEA